MPNAFQVGGLSRPVVADANGTLPLGVRPNRPQSVPLSITGDVTLTAAQCNHGTHLACVESAVGAGWALTTPAATAIIAATPDMAIGDLFEMTVFNFTDQTMTLTAGSGVTVKGTATLATNLAAKIMFTMVTASTMYAQLIQ